MKISFYENKKMFDPRLKYFLLLWLVLSVVGPSLQAEHVRATRQIHHPAPEIYSRWVENIFSTDEMWRFPSREAYERLVDAADLSPELKDQLKSLYLDAIDDRVNLAAHVDYDTFKKGGYVLVPKDLRRALSNEFAQKVYETQWNIYAIEPRLTMQKQSLLSEPRLSETARAQLLKNVIKLNGREILPIAPHNWDLLPESLRADAVDSFLTRSFEGGEGLSAFILIHARDDLAAIARKYAAGGDARAIERYLRLRLGSRTSVEIPLQNILPPFIRKYIDTYSPCHGPNCFNASLNVQRGRNYRVEHTDRSALHKQSLTQYRFVRPGEALQVGDLMIYADLSGEPQHVASYIGDGLVFTKSGQNRYKPYVFQKMETGEKSYFPNARYQLVVMRKPAAGESVASPDGKDVAPIVYRFGSAISVKANLLIRACAAAWKALLH